MRGILVPFEVDGIRYRPPQRFSAYEPIIDLYDESEFNKPPADSQDHDLDDDMPTAFEASLTQCHRNLPSQRAA